MKPDMLRVVVKNSCEAENEGHCATIIFQTLVKTTFAVVYYVKKKNTNNNN
jgi:hypothetical protein